MKDIERENVSKLLETLLDKTMAASEERPGTDERDAGLVRDGLAPDERLVKQRESRDSSSNPKGAHVLHSHLIVIILEGDLLAYEFVEECTSRRDHF